jgi:hypothetical protein
VDTSIVRCVADLFIARVLSFTRDDQDPSETITPLKLPFDSAIDMVMRSEITHSPSCVLMLKAERWLRTAATAR